MAGFFVFEKIKPHGRWVGCMVASDSPGMNYGASIYGCEDAFAFFFFDLFWVWEGLVWGLLAMTMAMGTWQIVFG